MRNLKKLLAVVVAVTILLTAMVPAFAASYVYEDEAQTLYDLGLYAGTSATEFVPDLGAKLTRAQGAVLVLKMFNLLDEANKVDADKVAETLAAFKDAKKIPTWADEAIAYAVEKKIISGRTDGNFDPAGSLKAKDFAMFVLKVVGVDSAYATAADKLAELGGLKIDNDKSLLRDDVVGIIYSGLSVKLADGKTVIEALVAAKPALKDIAVAAGLIDAATTATVQATGAKVLTVKFNNAVDTSKAVFSIKKGTLTVNVSKVEWNTEKTVATITLVSKLTEGDYAVTVSGLGIEAGKNVYTVKAEAEKVTAIEITSDVAPLTNLTDGDVTFNYVVKNQYGEDVTSAYASSLIWTPSSGSFGANPSVGAKLLNGAFAKDNTVTVTAIYPTSNVSVSKVLKVGDVAKVSKINVVGLYNADGNTLFSDSDFSTFYVKVEAFDQYGTAATVAQLNDAAQVTVVSTNSTVVTSAGFTTVDDTTALRLAKPASNVDGTATINFISNINGQSSKIDIVVAKPATLNKISLETPADLVVAGETVIIPFTAQDQNGVELTEAQKDAIPNTIFKTSYTGITFDFVYNYQTKKTELKMTVTSSVAAGNKLIMAATDAGNVSQITVDVKAPAVPVAVSGVKNFATLFTKGATSTVTDDDIVVLDTYGREMTLDASWFAKYRLDLTTSASDKVSLSAISIAADGGSANLQASAANVGSSTIGISVYDKTATTPATIADSSYEFTTETVEKSVIKEYAIDVPAVLYADNAHAKDVTVYGKTSSGTKVALAASDFVLSTNDANVTYVGGQIKASNAGMDVNTDKTVTALVIIDGANGPESVTKTITVTTKTPVVTTLAVADVTVSSVARLTVTGDTLYVKAAYVDAATLTAALTAEDQYGVAIAPSITNLLVTNVNGVTVTNNGNKDSIAISGAAATDTFTLTYVTQSGVSKTVSVVVVP